MSAEDSFQARVHSAVNGTYHTSMRRSLQSVALYEADRCLGPRYSQLRPFQKKYALVATAVDLLGTLDFLNDYHRQEIMFRTNTSKEQLAPDLAWRRMKLISREIHQTIVTKAVELMEADRSHTEKSHEEFCELLLQNMYEENNESSKPRPPMWEFNHTNVFTVYRIYYRGVTTDANLFPPKLHRMVAVPLKKSEMKSRQINTNASSISLDHMSIGGKGRGTIVMAEDERRAMLKEVKDHTELLKEFEGIIPEEELAKRKRALYDALPPVPPPFGGPVLAGGGKKQKKKAKVADGKVPALPEMAEPAAVAVPGTANPTVAATAMEEEDWENVGDATKEKDPATTLTSV